MMDETGSPTTPTKRRAATSSDLLALFSPSKEKTSRHRDLPPPMANTGADPSRGLRNRAAPVSYALSEHSDDPTSPSVASSAFGSPQKKSKGFAQLSDDHDSDDEPQVVVKRQRTTYAEGLRPRSNVSYATARPKGDRPSRKRGPRPRKASAIVQSDTATEAQAVATSSPARPDFVSATRSKRNRFLIAHKEYFQPLLPQKNFFSKLEEQDDASLRNEAVVPYRPLEHQPKG